MRIDITLVQTDKTHVTPQFECTDIGDVERAYSGQDMPEIPLSRDGENCWTPVTFLQSHNHHSPRFKGPTVFNYLSRVRDALVASRDDKLDEIVLHYDET